MGLPQGRTNGTKFTSETGRIAGSAPKTPSVKTIVKKILQGKLDLSQVEKEKLEKFLGVELTDEELTQELQLVAKLLKRARENDASLKMLLELGGQIGPGDVSDLPPVNINIGFGKDGGDDEDKT